MLASTTKRASCAYIMMVISVFSFMQFIILDLAGSQPQPLSSPLAELSQLQYRPFIWKSWRKLQKTSAVMPSLARARMPESILVCWKMGRNLQWRSLTPANSLIKNSLCRLCHLSFSHVTFPGQDAPALTPIFFCRFQLSQGWNMRMLSNSSDTAPKGAPAFLLMSMQLGDHCMISSMVGRKYSMSLHKLSVFTILIACENIYLLP